MSGSIAIKEVGQRLLVLFVSGEAIPELCRDLTGGRGSLRSLGKVTGLLPVVSVQGARVTGVLEGHLAPVRFPLL